MTTRNLSSLIFAAAVFALTCFPVEKLAAQRQGENRFSSSIGMLVNGGTETERWVTSTDGIMGFVAILPNERIVITLSGSRQKAGNPVGIGLLDGGAIMADSELFLDNDGFVSFTFEGGNIPGVYRVLASIGAEEYQLQFYVANPSEIAVGCILP